MQIELMSSRKFAASHAPSSAAPEPASLQALHRLLAQGLALPPEYRQGLSNHLPMVLQALHGLGASEAQMARFFASYRSHFDAEAEHPIAVDGGQEAEQDWLSLRGRDGAYPVLLAYFQQALRAQGLDAVMREAVPHLLPGISGAAFHGLIRVAHALASGYEPELAAGLAYWAWRWQRLEAAPAMPASERLPFDSWALAIQLEARHWRSQPGLISARMLEASRTSIYRGLAGRLLAADSAQERLDQFARLAVQSYVGSANFTVLHMITGLRALRALLPWLPASLDLQLLLTEHFTAAYLAANLTPLRSDARERQTENWAWPDLIAQTLESKDDHLIKLVYACQQEALRAGDASVYLQAVRLACARAQD
ncbi:hypothetical protein DBR47_01750 [Paucibacter sp. KBW04]|uniref:questin oxidase family protein n=1 Tax=Paucibacter sp. KBW04 TaxID=2153361 RepID=UPI000F58AE27|nr:questin oxidase family protein [Paucibacter sp. KBW04]RQO63294.1 hypothetical protein DBR47_01750 [Paucibacter sp. KBW04]